MDSINIKLIERMQEMLNYHSWNFLRALGYPKLPAGIAYNEWKRKTLF
jgi:hypothetical protein